MSKKGWVDVALKEETAEWLDAYVKSNPHGLKSRAAVVEYALSRLRSSVEDPLGGDLEGISDRVLAMMKQIDEERRKRKRA